jgi:hypothetical protein
MYSANIGSKDVLQPPRVEPEGFEYVYFVDDKEQYESDTWDIREVPVDFGDTRLTARWYKTHPHLLFSGEDTIWIDGNYTMIADPTPLFVDDIVLFRHDASGDRACLYAEAAACLKLGAGNPEMLRKQVEYYKRQGMPELNGLIASNVLLRKPAAALLNEEWWDQIVKFSRRDQVSLPYVLWKNATEYSSFSHQQKTQYFNKRRRHLFHGTKEVS